MTLSLTDTGTRRLALGTRTNADAADYGAAFVDIRSIGGPNGETNRKLSQQICKLLKDSLGRYRARDWCYGLTTFSMIIHT